MSLCLGCHGPFFSQKPKSIWFLVGETIFWLDTLEHYFRSSPEKQFGLLAWVVIQDGDLWSTRQNDAYQRRNFTLFISFRLGLGSARIAQTLFRQAKWLVSFSYIEPVFLVLRVWLLLVSEWRVTKLIFFSYLVTCITS